MKFYRRLMLPILVVIGLNFALAGGYWLLYLGRAFPDGRAVGFLDCLYMTVISTFTVGYGETLPIDVNRPFDRIYTMMVILAGAGIIGYGISQLTAFIVEGELRNILGRRKMDKQIAALRGHFVVCGAGDVGSYILDELISTKRPFVVVDLDEARMKKLAEDRPVLYLAADATDEAVLARVGIREAAGVMCTLANDRDNLFLAMTCRQLNPKLRIVAKSHDVKISQRMKNAGADAVVSPQYIGSLRLVSEMIRPSVVSFLDTMLRDKGVATRVEEVRISPESELAGKALNEVNLPKRKVLVMAVRTPAMEKFDYVPSPDTLLWPGTTLIVLGGADRVAEIRAVAEKPPSVPGPPESPQPGA